jgi:hypothetical protein
VSEPTEQDRLKATDLIAEHGTGDPDFFGDLTTAIAAALAEERAKAQAPFLALADEYDRHAGLMRAQAESIGVPDMVPRSQAFEDAAATIRRAVRDRP